MGIWFDGGFETYYLDGDFIVNLPTLYGDSNWQLYDPDTREVFYTDTLEGCEGAARPDVDPQYQNHCVECSLDYVDGGISATLLIPATPVSADQTGRLGMLAGVSLIGIVLAAPAPVRDILANYTIAAFDDCGGHINPHEGYHYHSASVSENLFVGCYHGLIEASASRAPGGRPPPDGERCPPPPRR